MLPGIEGGSMNVPQFQSSSKWIKSSIFQSNRLIGAPGVSLTCLRDGSRYIVVYIAL